MLWDYWKRYEWDDGKPLWTGNKWGPLTVELLTLLGLRCGSSNGTSGKSQWPCEEQWRHSQLKESLTEGDREWTYTPTSLSSFPVIACWGCSLAVSNQRQKRLWKLSMPVSLTGQRAGWRAENGSGEANTRHKARSSSSLFPS